MPQAILDTTAIAINAECRRNKRQKYGLKTTGAIMRFDGYLKVWPQNLKLKNCRMFPKKKIDFGKRAAAPAFTEPRPATRGLAH